MVIPDYILALAAHGIEVLIEPFVENKGKENEFDCGLCIAIGGFYKNSRVHLIRSGGFADFETCTVIGRYGRLGNVSTLEDMVALNYSEWQRFEHKGFTVDPTWINLLKEFGYIREVVEVKYVPNRLR